MRLAFPGRKGGGAASRLDRRNLRADRSHFVPRSEPLEERSLLSTVAHASHADLLAPPAAEVANAATILEAKAGADFAKLVADVTAVEKASSVRPGQFAQFEYDTTTIDLAITTSGLATRLASQQLNTLQNTLDQSFLAGTYRGSGWSQLEAKVSASITGVMVNYVLSQSQVAATTPHGVISNQFIQETFNQMRTIAHQAHVTAAEHTQIVSDEQAVLKDLGANPNVDLGGISPRNPLTVWLDGEVPNFVHKRPATARSGSLKA